MKSIKIVIISLVVLLIFSIILLVFINSNSISPENNILDIGGSGPQDELIKLNAYTEKETDDTKIFEVNEYIDEMLNYENNNNSEAVKQIVTNSQEVEKLDIKQKQSIFYVQEMYRRENLKKASYFVKGIIRTIDMNYKETLSELYFKVDLDYVTSGLQMSVIKHTEYETETKNTQTVVEDFNIELNEYNGFEQKGYSTQEICNKYLSDFIIKLKYNRELAFEVIDAEYKQKKFNNDLAVFNEYIDNNKDRIYNVTIQKYLKNIKENSIEYTILDTYGNYYIIDCTGGLDYKIMLDNYTIETEEFISAYEQASEQEKITTNISKVVQWINTKDYSQMYNKLDQTFRQNNFPNLETFKKYMQNNFFSFNNMEVQKIEKISDNYVCDVSLSSGYGLASEQTTKTFIMQLKEGTDFVMSFTR